MIRYLVTLIPMAGGVCLGWWLGSFIGFMTAYFLGVVGGSFGLYVGRWFVRNHLGD